MTAYRLTFASPYYLLLLAGLPVLWWLSFRGLAGLGRWRRLIALGLRSAVAAMLVLAAAEARIVRSTDQLTVIFLLDQSLSIPKTQRETMIEYVKAEVRRHRRDKDRVGVIVFGREAAIEIPPLDDELPLPRTVESPLDPEYTNLADALKLAQAAFPEDAARRIVVVSDGNQNLGNALEQAQALAATGIGIDVVPIRYEHRSDVAVERVVIPADVRRGQTFDLRVVINNTHGPGEGRTGEVRGRVVIKRITESGEEIINPKAEDQIVVLPPGKKVFTWPETIDRPSFYTYDARFTPERPEDDATPQNNRATAFTQVQGKGRVLIIEDYEHRGEHAVLADRLGQQNLDVTVRTNEQLFADLAELQAYDAVVLANVPRSSGQDVGFSDRQIDALVQNTQQLGAGLVMLGGQNSFGAGGWTGSELEKAMPVDFQVQNAKVVPRGALAMIMHASEMAQGNFWQKKIVTAAIQSLGPQDYCGVIHWDGTERWLWQGGLVPIGQQRQQMLARVDRMMPGDMPDFEPTMALAFRGFRSLPDAAVKHMIVISDGDPSAPSSRTLNGLVNLNVTISTVAVGAHQTPQTLKDIATAGGGKFYQVNNANALPRIFQREARRVARPLVYEDAVGMTLEINRIPQMASGIESLPPITGYVLTTKKESSQVEVALTAPKPAGEQNSTVLAGWQYGAGKAVAFTSDAGFRWTGQWQRSPAYDKLFGQIIRWAMRPAGDSGKFTVATEVADGQVRLVVNALDKNDDFLNFLTLSGTALGPDLKPVPIRMEQTAPGRYVGSFPAKDAGSYFVNINPGGGMAPIRLGATVPYSDEFRDRATNDALLGQMADLTPKGGTPGMVIEDREDAGLEGLLAVNTYRHDLAKATSNQDAWQYLLLLASCIFFADVLVRRVHVSFAWVLPLAGRALDKVLGREPPPVQAEYFERLRSRKAEVDDRLAQLRAATRFEAPEQAPTADVRILEAEGGPAPPPLPAAPSITPEEKTEEESYTERLLRAKKKVWEERKDER